MTMPFVNWQPGAAPLNSPTPWSQSGTAHLYGPNPWSQSGTAPPSQSGTAPSSQSGTAPLSEDSLQHIPGSFGPISETSQFNFHPSYALLANNADSNTRGRAGDDENVDMVSGIFSDREPL
jgi:hypothetical protein